MESTFFTGLSGYSEAANFRCSCGIARRLGPPVRTGAHVGAQNGAHVGAQIGAPSLGLELIAARTEPTSRRERRACRTRPMTRVHAT